MKIERRPLALIDVDGVLDPYAAHACPPGYAEHELPDGELVRVNPGHGPLLRQLSPTYELVWATSWQHDANRLLAPLLGLPALPVIEFPPHPEGVHYDKYPTIAEAVGDRACAWIDDLHSAPAHDWAANRRVPTQLIHVDPAVGLTNDHIQQALRFRRDVARRARGARGARLARGPAIRRSDDLTTTPLSTTRFRVRPERFTSMSVRKASLPPMQFPLSRRTVIAGALGGVAASTLGVGTAAAAARPPQVLIATNEPWGTYHVEPLLAEAARRGWRLTQLVPDYSEVTPDDPVPVATPADAPDADLLVVTGAGDWPAECVARFRRLPVVASSLAYQQPVEAPHADRIRPRLRAFTSSSAAESRAFARYLGTRRPIRVVGSPQTDDLPARTPETDLVLVLTSVTHPDDTGSAAPGTELLLAAAGNLAASGKRILVGLHPREDPDLWSDYEISSVDSVTASARAEAAIGIPGTVFPLVAAVGTPLVGCTDPVLTVPDYLLAVCSSTIDAPGQAVAAIDDAHLPDQATLTDAVGPIGGSARRLLDAWDRIIRRGPRQRRRFG